MISEVSILNIWGSLPGKILMTLLLSMTPILELRGAIPIATANGLNLYVTIVISVIGNLIPVPFIILFIRRIFGWMRTKSERLNGVVARLETRAAKKSELVYRYAFWGIVVLVAIPLPGTGAWTGALVAAMLEMRLKTAFPAIALGVLIAGIIVSFVTYGVGAILF
ncbi:MAG: small multi-drug export protein [Oscillospiraceae bacterium]|nr:small multi-drug export protein [Oscillospiraceae bacterium]